MSGILLGLGQLVQPTALLAPPSSASNAVGSWYSPLRYLHCLAVL